MSFSRAGSLISMTVLMEGITFGESPRWHDGRVWFSDWGAHQVIALDPQDGHEVVVSVESFPMCIDFLPDGRLLVVDSAHRRLLRRELDGSIVTHADLSAVSEKPWNDIVADALGNAYVNTIGFDFPGGEPAPGSVVLVTPAGDVHKVADDLAFPNGMAITADGETCPDETADVGAGGRRPPRRHLHRRRRGRLVRRRGKPALRAGARGRRGS
jgi:sugar lactone lactonase YvrE